MTQSNKYFSLRLIQKETKLCSNSTTSGIIVLSEKKESNLLLHPNHGKHRFAYFACLFIIIIY